jgi:antitoxin component YwqK of YwqJK toxin-antitoxin module
VTTVNPATQEIIPAVRAPTAVLLLCLLALPQACGAETGGEGASDRTLNEAPRGFEASPDAEPVAGPSAEPVASPQDTAPADRGAPAAPSAWTVTDSFEGTPVDVLEDFFSSGRPRRRYCVVVGSGETGAGVEHGPDWAWFESTQRRWAMVWVRGRRNGLERRWFKSGHLRSEGMYVEGEKDGLWKQWFDGGEPRIERTWSRGVADGPQREWYKSGFSRTESEFDGGLQIDVHREYGRTGLLLLEESWTAGRRRGPVVAFHPESEQVKARGTYADDLRVGGWEEFSPNGQILLRVTYQVGRAHGLEERWLETGGLVSRIEYADGIPEGLTIAWYPSGKKQMEGRMAKGRRVGPWTYWLPDGSEDPAWTGHYEDDRRSGD